MEKKAIPEVIISSSDKKRSAIITQLKRKGEIIKIAPRIYTSNLADAPERYIPSMTATGASHES